MIVLFFSGLIVGMSPILFLIIYMWDELKVAWKIRIAKSRHIPLMLMADTAGYIRLLFAKYTSDNKIIAYDGKEMLYMFKLESKKQSRIDFYLAGAKTFLAVDKKHRVLSIKDLIELNIISNPILRQELWNQIYGVFREKYIIPLREYLFSLFKEWLKVNQYVTVAKQKNGKEVKIPLYQVVGIDDFKTKYKDLYLEFINSDRQIRELDRRLNVFESLKPETPDFEKLLKIMDKYDINLKIEVENRPLDFSIIKSDTASPIDLAHTLISGFSAGLDERRETEMPIKKSRMNLLTIIAVVIGVILIMFLLVALIPQAAQRIAPVSPSTGQGVRP